MDNLEHVQQHMKRFIWPRLMQGTPFGSDQTKHVEILGMLSLYHLVLRY